MRMRSDSDLRIRRQGMDHRHPRAHNFPGVCLPLTCANLLLAGWGYAALAPYPTPPLQQQRPFALPPPPAPPLQQQRPCAYAMPAAPAYGYGYENQVAVAPPSNETHVAVYGSGYGSGGYWGPGSGGYYNSY